MLGWVFGDLKKNEVHLNKVMQVPDISNSNTQVRWFLSVNYDYIPEKVKESGQRTYRSITVDEKEIEFSVGCRSFLQKALNKFYLVTGLD